MIVEQYSDDSLVFAKKINKLLVQVKPESRSLIYFPLTTM